MVFWSPSEPTNPLSEGVGGRRAHAHHWPTSVDLNIFNGIKFRSEYCPTTCFLILLFPNIFSFCEQNHTKISQQHQAILKNIFWARCGGTEPPHIKGGFGGARRTPPGTTSNQRQIVAMKISRIDSHAKKSPKTNLDVLTFCEVKTVKICSMNLCVFWNDLGPPKPLIGGRKGV